MTPPPYDWTSARGDKWRAHLRGMEAMLDPVDAPLIRALRLDGPLRIADLGCGGGGTTQAIHRQAPAGSVVHGYDVCGTLVETARERAPGDGIAFQTANVETTPVPDAPYDRLVSRFGVMFYEDPRAAFGSLRRWLVPGGRFAFAVWAQPADNPWLTTVREVVAELVELPASEPDAPGPFRYADPEALRTLLGQAGFAELAVEDWRGTLPIGGALAADEAARFALASFSSFAEALASRGEGALDEARRSLTQRLRPYQRDSAVRMDARVHLLTGTRRQ